MLDVEKIPQAILTALSNRGHSLSAITLMTPEKAFDEYCEWEGLIGYGAHLRNVLMNLQDANEP